jgi:preprotein translocase subunit YajC
MQPKLLLLLGLAPGLALATPAYPSAAASLQNQDASQQQGEQQATTQGARRGFGRGGPMDGHGVIGKITSIGKDSIEVTRPDGSTAIVKLSDHTEFRKDRQPAKLSDFKAGEYIFVRGDENADHSFAAQIVAGRTGSGAQGDRLFSNGFRGELGKDLVVGEVKSIEAPNITVLRPDNVTQTLELTEDTALRKGRESITMADIQPGDHLIARGGVQNNIFVPKNLFVLTAEQWQRMQEMGMENGVRTGASAPNTPKPNPPQP